MKNDRKISPGNGHTAVLVYISSAKQKLTKKTGHWIACRDNSWSYSYKYYLSHTKHKNNHQAFSMWIIMPLTFDLLNYEMNQIFFLAVVIFLFLIHVFIAVTWISCSSLRYCKRLTGSSCDLPAVLIWYDKQLSDENVFSWKMMTAKLLKVDLFK